MKSQLVKRICKKYLLPSMPEYEIKGHLLYYQNFEYLLPGFYFESSAFDKSSFTIWVFIQPLYIPADDIWFRFGNRLGSLAKGRDIWWEYTEENEGKIMQEVLSLILLAGIPYLEARKSINDFVFQSRNQINFSGDTNIIEAVSYGHILAGEFQIAEKLLGKLSIELSHEVKNEPQILWLLEAQQRVQLVLQYLQERVPENAIKQLNEWEKFTLSKNGLVKKSINRQIDE